MTKSTRSWTASLGLKTMATMLLSTLLVSCGSSKKYDEFIPTRIVSAGDAMSYLDASPVVALPAPALTAYANSLTVIEDNANTNGIYDHWLKQFAMGYWSPSLGNSSNTTANIVMLRTAPPVVGRHADTPTPSDAKLADIQTQLAGFTPRADDLLIMSVGLGDILELSETYLTGVGGNTNLNTLKNTAYARGQAYMDYANLLYQNGTFKRIVLVNPIDISNSPYAQQAKAGSTLSPAVDVVISQITEQFTYGLKSNASTYPRNGGVWLFDATNLLLNINLTALNVNLTVPVCDEAATPRAQVCSARAADIAADIALGVRATNNPNTLLNPNRTDPTNAVLALTTTTGTTSNYSSVNYFFAGSILPTPLVHRYMGSTLYNRMRSGIGF
jgi:hypothetical protein